VRIHSRIDEAKGFLAEEIVVGTLLPSFADGQRSRNSTAAWANASWYASNVHTTTVDVSSAWTSLSAAGRRRYQMGSTRLSYLRGDRR
jgi:hypothetical protein